MSSCYFQDGFDCRLGGIPRDFCPYRPSKTSVEGFTSSLIPYREWQKGWGGADVQHGTIPKCANGLSPKITEERHKRLKQAREGART